MVGAAADMAGAPLPVSLGAGLATDALLASAHEKAAHETVTEEETRGEQEHLCENGALALCEDVGVRYWAEENWNRAAYYFAKACAGELLGSCAALADSKFMQKDYPDARRLFTKARQGGDPGGCGMICENAELLGLSGETPPPYSGSCTSTRIPTPTLPTNSLPPLPKSVTSEVRPR